MDTSLNHILNRLNDVALLDEYIQNFYDPNTPVKSKKAIYITGKPGIGKTWFVKDTLKRLNLDPIVYDISDVRNKNIIDTISNSNISTLNVHELLFKTKKRIVIVMDDVDGMNLGDKAGINSFIKLIRPKKTKKQQLEPFNNIPVVCIGNVHGDKKIKELMKVSNIIELNVPTKQQMLEIIALILPRHDADKIYEYVHSDLRKLNGIYKIFKNDPLDVLKHYELLNTFLKMEYKMDNVKEIALTLLKTPTQFSNHSAIISDPDRTIVGLLFHENIMDIFDKHNSDKKLHVYVNILTNFCFSDYHDRIIFQKQIWQLNEMSSLTKTFYNNYILHQHIVKPKITEIRFTKVLTKYSTEFNNTTFINNMSQQLMLDKKDLFLYFYRMKQGLHSAVDMSQLDIFRMYRFLQKYDKSYNLINEE